MSIPIEAAKEVAHKYGYDQVVIVGRRIGDDGLEWVTTYGKTKAHCEVAARIGKYLREKIMVSPKPDGKE